MDRRATLLLQGSYLFRFVRSKGKYLHFSQNHCVFRLVSSDNEEKVQVRALDRKNIHLHMYLYV